VTFTQDLLWPRGRGAEKRDELPPFHGLYPQAKSHGLSIAGQGRVSQQKRPPHVRLGSDSVIPRCPAQCPAYPKADKAGRFNEYATWCGNLVVLPPGPKSPPAKCRDPSAGAQSPTAAERSNCSPPAATAAPRLDNGHSRESKLSASQVCASNSISFAGLCRLLGHESPSLFAAMRRLP
jgi:hypothetical protein